MKPVSFDDSLERSCVDNHPKEILDTLGEDTCLFLLVECLNLSICKYFCLLVIRGSLAFQGNKTSMKVKENLKKA